MGRCQSGLMCLSRKQVGFRASGVRISLFPPKKEAYFDRKMCFLFPCQKALISKDFNISRHKLVCPGALYETGFSCFCLAAWSSSNKKVCFVGKGRLYFMNIFPYTIHVESVSLLEKIKEIFKSKQIREGSVFNISDNVIL